MTGPQVLEGVWPLTREPQVLEGQPSHYSRHCWPVSPGRLVRFVVTMTDLDCLLQDSRGLLTSLGSARLVIDSNSNIKQPDSAKSQHHLFRDSDAKDWTSLWGPQDRLARGWDPQCGKAEQGPGPKVTSHPKSVTA